MIGRSLLSLISHTSTLLCRCRFEGAEMGDGVAAEGTLPPSAAAHVCGPPRHATSLHKHIEVFLSLVSFSPPRSFRSCLARLEEGRVSRDLSGWQASRRLHGDAGQRAPTLGSQNQIILKLWRLMLSELQDALPRQALPLCMPSSWRAVLAFSRPCI